MFIFEAWYSNASEIQSLIEIAYGICHIFVPDHYALKHLSKKKIKEESFSISKL